MCRRSDGIVCVTIFVWPIGWRFIRFGAIICRRNCRRSVSVMRAILSIYFSILNLCRIRGTLGSLMMVSANLGILLAFTIGHYFPYTIVPRIFICLPIVFLLSLFMLPETPHYFMRTNREHVSFIVDLQPLVSFFLPPQKARKSLKFYRNSKSCNLITANVDRELERLKCTGKDNEIELSYTIHDFSKFRGRIKRTIIADKKKFAANRAARKAMLIGLFLMFLHEFCGCFTMINYTATIFRESGSEISPGLSAIIVATVQLVGTIVSMKLVDRAGRKVFVFFCFGYLRL